MENIHFLFVYREFHRNSEEFYNGIMFDFETF